MRNKILIVILAFFMMVPSTKALMCGNEVKVKYSEMAKNISVNYEYVESENDVIFNIKFSNIPEKFIIYDIEHEINYMYQGSELTIPNVNKNSSYKYGVYIDNISCKYELLYTHYITIPPYNYYYKDEVCNGIEDYKLCNKWLNITISYDEWKSKVIEYKNSLNVELEEIQESEKTIFEKIIDFYIEYYLVILLGVIITCCVCIYSYNRKHDLF